MSLGRTRNVGRRPFYWTGKKEEGDENNLLLRIIQQPLHKKESKRGKKRMKQVLFVVYI